MPRAQIAKVVPCQACGVEVGLVRLPQSQWRAIHLEPKTYGMFVVLPDGVRAIPVDAFYVRNGLDCYDGPRYVAHYDLCDARGLRRVGWAAERFAAASDTVDRRRERIRAAKLAADHERDVSPRRRPY